MPLSPSRIGACRQSIAYLQSTLGCLERSNVTSSGKSAEIEAAIPHFRARECVVESGAATDLDAFSARVLAVVGSRGTPLGTSADACAIAPASDEILGHVPSRSSMFCCKSLHDAEG